MAVIVVASPKGGVGKTTISIILAEELAHMGYSIGVVEADKARHISKYLAAREREDRRENFTLYTDEDASTLGSTIKHADAEHEIVVVDLPGFEGLEFTRAVARANLVLIPMKPTVMDHSGAVTAMEQIAIEEDHLDRPINYRLVLNMVQDAVNREKARGLPKTERALRNHIAQANYPRLDAEVTNRRGPIPGYYAYGLAPHEYLEDNGSDSAAKAYNEVLVLTCEVEALLVGQGTDEVKEATA